MNEKFVEFMNNLTVRKQVTDLYYKVLLEVYKDNECDRKKNTYEIDAEL